MRERITNKVNICCFSSRYVHKKVLVHTPTQEEKENREKRKLLEIKNEVRKWRNPVKFWKNKQNELLMVSMATAKSIKI